RADAQAVHAMQLAVRLAAAEASIWACDTVYGTVSDPDGYTREATAARRLGFVGKSCIHPTQVPLANAVFRPTDGEIAAARRVVEAAQGAERDGVGAFLVDGRMIDVPFIKRAESILGAAPRCVLLGCGVPGVAAGSAEARRGCCWPDTVRDTVVTERRRRALESADLHPIQARPVWPDSCDLPGKVFP